MEAVAGFEDWLNFEELYCGQNAVEQHDRLWEACYDRKESISEADLLSHFKKLHRSSQPPPCSVCSPSAWRQDPPPVKRLHLAEGLADG